MSITPPHSVEPLRHWLFQLVRPASAVRTLPPARDKTEWKQQKQRKPRAGGRVVLDTHSLANETLTGTPFFVIRTPPPPHCHVSPRRPCGGEDPLPLPGKCRRGGMGSHPCAWTTTTTTNRRGPSVRAQGEARRRGDGQPVQR